MNAGVASAHPTRQPGPTILLKLPLLTQLPNLSTGPLSKVRSMSIRRGSIDLYAGYEVEVARDDIDEEIEGSSDGANCE